MKHFKNVIFNEEKHTYHIDNQKLLSTTQFISRFKKDIFTEAFIHNYAIRHNYTPDYVKSMWNIKKQYGMLKGTEVHFYIESYIKNLKYEPIMDVQLYIEQFHNFVQKYKPKFKYTELVIGDKNINIGGCIDAIIERNDKLYLIDWKTNKNFSMTSDQKFKKINIEQSDFNSYSLQLSMYRYILEKHNINNIGGMFIVWLNPNNENYQTIKIPYQKNIIKKMLQYDQNKIL